MAKLILYACPTGPFADQIQDYFEQSKQQCGENAAHAYMPHCTLTGFFEDEESAIPIYITAVKAAIATHQKQMPSPPIQVQSLDFRAHWHGLTLQSDWLNRLVADFAEKADSPTRSELLRLKDWLHLSLAYDFQPQHAQTLEALAEEHIDISAPVNWEIRFYGRRQQNDWTCYYSAAL